MAWKNSGNPVSDGMKKSHAATAHHVPAHGAKADAAMKSNAGHKAVNPPTTKGGNK